MQTTSFVAVVGASGSGKSSLVRAGLLPVLRNHDPPLTVVVMTPGSHPFEELRHAAREAGARDVTWRGDSHDAMRSLHTLVDGGERRALLVVDQFEELLTLADDEVADRFVANLVEVADDPQKRCGVLVAVRADFVERALGTPAIADRLAEGIVVVPPMGPTGIEAAAVEPAASVGVSVEPELVAVLAADMQAQPGALPLFQFALTTTFEHHTGGTLRRADYEAVGGMSGALARRAEETFQTLGPAERDAVRQLFLRLVAVDTRGSVTRRRITRTEVETLGFAEATTHAVLDAFDRARLLTFDRSPDGDPTVEVAHEALIGGWPRLAGWLDDVLDDLRLHRRLTAEVTEWTDAGRSDDYLIAGSRLAAYDTWPAAGSIRPSADERSFLERSRQARDERRRREASSRRRLRGLVALATAAAVAASGLAVVSIRSNAESRSAAQAAQARTLAEASMAAREADLAVLLASEAVRTARRSGRPVPSAYDALHQALDADRQVSHIDDAAAVAFAGDGSLVVAGERTRLVDPRTGDETAALGFEEAAVSVSASADGETVLAGSTSGGLMLGDTQTQAAVPGFPADVSPTDEQAEPHVALSPDGRWAAARYAYDVALTLWNTETGDLVGRRSWTDDDTFRAGEGLRLDGIEVTNDGSVYYVNRTGVQTLTRGGDFGAVVEPATAAFTDVALSSDGQVLTASKDGTLALWATDGRSLSSLLISPVALTSLAVGDDGRVVALDTDGAVHVVAAHDGILEHRRSFPGSDRPLVGAALRGPLAAAVDAAGRAYVWDVSDDGGGELGRWPGDGPVAVSVDGDLMATGGADLSVEVYRLSDDTLLTSLPHPASGGSTLGPSGPPGAPAWLYDGLTTRLVGLTFTPTGRLIATYQYAAESQWTTSQPVVAVWEPQSGDPIQVWRDWRVIFGPIATDNAATLAAAVCAGGSAAWVFEAQEEQAELSGLLPFQQCGRSVDLDPSGSRVVVQVANGQGPTPEELGTVQVWDLDTLDLLVQAEHAPATGGSVRFSPDGTQLLSAGRDGTARVWDAETGDPVAVLRASSAPMEAAEWSPDGSRVVTSSQDGKVRVWDMPSATITASISVAERGTWPHVALLPDGQHVLTSSDGLVRLWTLDPGELLDLADQRTSRSLSPAECTRYGIEDCPRE